MKYEPPRIVRRERVAAVLTVGSNADGQISDVNLKANIVPVTW